MDLELEGLLERVSDRKVIEMVRRRMKDGRVVRVIEKYVGRGVIKKGLLEGSEEGSGEGGGLSGVVRKMMVKELEKEVRRGGVGFVGYGDEWMIFCKWKGGGKGVKECVRGLMEGKVDVKVKREKRVVWYVEGVK